MDDTFHKHLDQLEHCLGRGDLRCAERIFAAALDSAKTNIARAEWLRKHAEVLAEFGSFRRAKEMAIRALGEIQSIPEGEIQSTPECDRALGAECESIRLSTLEFASRVVDPPVSTDLAREAVRLANQLLGYKFLDQKAQCEIWISLANAYGVLGMPVDRLGCYLNALTRCIEARERLLVWLGVADARREVDGFEASYQVLNDHVLPEIKEFPELASITFLQIGDLFLDNEQWNSACMAYGVARDGLKDDAIRRHNHAFVADLQFKLASGLINLGDVQESIQAAEAARNLADADTPPYVTWGAHLILGTAKSQVGRVHEALCHFQAVVTSTNASDTDRRAAIDGINSMTTAGRIQ